MVCGSIDGIQKSMLDPEVDELHHEPVGGRFHRRGPDFIRHPRAMAKEVRKPVRLNYPNEGVLRTRHVIGMVRYEPVTTTGGLSCPLISELLIRKQIASAISDGSITRPGRV